MAEWWRLAASAILAVAAAAWLARRYGRRLVTWWRDTRARRAKSETHYFEAARRAARTGDSGAFVTDATAWLARFEPLGDTPTFERLAALSGDEALARESSDLERRLYARGGPGSGRERAAIRHILSRMSAARERLRTGAAPRVAAPGRDLAPLNPVG